MHQINSENLVFLISQPRSGSSMLQQILISSGEILSVPEPWIMLPLVYVYKKTGMTSEFNPMYANINFMQYLSKYDGSTNTVKNCIKETALKLYNLNQLQTHQKYFLDKTPRYYHIVGELLELFPESKFIFLSRNPASVFASILEYNFKGKLAPMFRPDRLDDLLKAPNIICNLKQSGRNPNNQFFIKYEDVVADPEQQLGKLFQFLQLDFTYDDIHYHLAPEFINTDSVDKKSLAKHASVVADYMDSWRLSINDYQKKSLLLEYIEILGKPVFDTLGYDYTETIKGIKNHNVKFRMPIKWDLMAKNINGLSMMDYFYFQLEKITNRTIEYVSRKSGTIKC